MGALHTAGLRRINSCTFWKEGCLAVGVTDLETILPAVRDLRNKVIHLHTLIFNMKVIIY